MPVIQALAKELDPNSRLQNRLIFVNTDRTRDVPAETSGESVSPQAIERAFGRFQFPSEVAARILSQLSKTFTLMQFVRRQLLLFEKIGSGNCDHFPVLRDQPFDDVISGMSGI